MLTYPVLFLEDDLDLLAALKTMVENKLGCKVMCADSFQQMVEKQDHVLGCKVAILDIDLGRGKPTGVDACHWLRHHGFEGHISFLTAHGRSCPLVRDAQGCEAEILSKPIEPSVLLDLIEKEVYATV